MKTNKQTITDLLARADITLNGSNPWDPQVHDERLYAKVLKSGSLGLGEAYMDGWWDCDRLDDFFSRVLNYYLGDEFKINWRLFWQIIHAQVFNYQSRKRAFHIGLAHYDKGNLLYQKMLGKTMAYSCGYWPNAVTLDEAQEAKFDLICRKIGLQSGMRLLDIGCGWGTFLKYAVEHYGVSGVGITVSQEQIKLARELCRDLPIEIRLQDYRDLKEKFDAVVSVGMFEHVGYKNYRTYLATVRHCLADNSLFLLHTIGSNVSNVTVDPWISTYIFPNSLLPSLKQIGAAMEKLFVMEDWHNFGADYDKTLMAWFLNFDRHWTELKHHYDERFYRMWKYYLLSCAGLFRSRKTQLWQIVLSKEGVPGGYQTVR